METLRRRRRRLFDETLDTEHKNGLDDSIRGRSAELCPKDKECCPPGKPDIDVL